MAASFSAAFLRFSGEFLAVGNARETLEALKPDRFRLCNVRERRLHGFSARECEFHPLEGSILGTGDLLSSPVYDRRFTPHPIALSWAHAIARQPDASDVVNDLSQMATSGSITPLDAQLAATIALRWMLKSACVQALIDIKNRGGVTELSWIAAIALGELAEADLLTAKAQAFAARELIDELDKPALVLPALSVEALAKFKGHDVATDAVHRCAIDGRYLSRSNFDTASMPLRQRVAVKMLSANSA